MPMPCACLADMSIGQLTIMMIRALLLKIRIRLGNVIRRDFATYLSWWISQLIDKLRSLRSVAEISNLFFVADQICVTLRKTFLCRDREEMNLENYKNYF